MAFGIFDPEDAVRDGWARDKDDEVSFDGYNAFLQITTNDGSSGFSVTNSTGGVAFQAKSDGDGYVARNLGVGLLNPTEKLDVGGVAKMQGFHLPPGGFDGYVITSDDIGVGTWQPPPSDFDGIDEGEHRDLDQLVHLISEDSFDEIVKDTCGKTSACITWTSAAKVLKIREQLITRDVDKKVSVITTKQYDGAGLVVETMTETLARDSTGRVVSVTRSVVL